MFGDNTYEPASGAAVAPATASEGVRPEQAVETIPIEAPMELEIPTTPPNDTEPSFLSWVKKALRRSQTHRRKGATTVRLEPIRGGEYASLNRRNT